MKLFNLQFKKRYLLVLALLSFLNKEATGQFLHKRTFEVNGHLIKIKALNQEIENLLDKASIPGLSFAVIDHGRVVFYNTYGYKKMEKFKDQAPKGKGKVNKRTLFEACSLSKSFFVFAVHKLVDQGVLDLDIPLYQYLPNPRLEYDERYKKITARMVLCHTSGIENWQSYNDSKKLEIINEPGEKYLYSGEGYEYLSKVVEKIIGKSIENYMTELVYKPLKLRRTFTTFSKNKRRPSNYCLGHNSFMQSSPKIKYTSPAIAGDINTTAGNYAQLLTGFFNNNNLSNERLNDIIGKNSGNRSYWGPGFALYHKDGDTILYQDGDNTGFKGFGFYSLPKKIGFVMLVNVEHGLDIRRDLDSLTVQTGLFDFHFSNLSRKVLKVYNERGYLPALNYFKSLTSEQNSQITKTDFEDLRKLFREQEPQFSKYINQEYMSRYPPAQ
jgi:CubicO group peptidase (beta-lactamase class C family)